MTPTRRTFAKAVTEGLNRPQERETAMCTAHGCPNRWSVSYDSGDGARGMCSAHAWSQPNEWPAITDHQRSMRAHGYPHVMPPPDPPAVRPTLTFEQSPRMWASVLKTRDEAGEKLTPFQREAYKAALSRSELYAQADELPDVNDRQTATARRVAEYAAEKGLTL